jgi:signal peptidase I
MNLARTLTFASRLVDALLVAIVAAVLACVVLTAVVPRLGHPVLVIRGGSMEPAIPLGSLVVLDPGVPADLQVGDVVSFQATNGTTVTHRVTRLASLGSTPSFGTKGDANADPDPVITPASAIIGRVAWSVPGAGYLVTLLSVPSGFLAVFLMAATLLCLALLLDELAYDRRHHVRRPAPVGALAISRKPVGGDS